MPAIITLKKTLEKNKISRDVKNYHVCDSDIDDLLKFPISCKNCGTLSQGRE